MKNNFRRSIVKLFFSVKGWFKEKKFKENTCYTTHTSPNVYKVYRGDRTFYQTVNVVDNQYGVQYSSGSPRKYAYWEIGVMKWKEYSKIEYTT